MDDSRWRAWILANPPFCFYNYGYTPTRWRRLDNCEVGHSQFLDRMPDGQPPGEMPVESHSSKQDGQTVRSIPLDQYVSDDPKLEGPPFVDAPPAPMPQLVYEHPTPSDVSDNAKQKLLPRLPDRPTQEIPNSSSSNQPAELPIVEPEKRNPSPPPSSDDSSAMLPPSSSERPRLVSIQNFIYVRSKDVDEGQQIKRISYWPTGIRDSQWFDRYGTQGFGELLDTEKPGLYRHRGTGVLIPLTNGGSTRPIHTDTVSTGVIQQISAIRNSDSSRHLPRISNLAAESKRDSAKSRFGIWRSLPSN